MLFPVPFGAAKAEVVSKDAIDIATNKTEIIFFNNKISSLQENIFIVCDLAEKYRFFLNIS